MVACVNQIVLRTAEAGHGTSNQWHVMGIGMPGCDVKFLGGLRCKKTGDFLLVVRKDVDGKVVGLRECIARMRRLSDADQKQRRIKRH